MLFFCIVFFNLVMLLMVNFMFYYLNMFLLGSFIGFVWENGLKLIFPSVNSGLLHGPWVPVYGIGICIIIFIERFVFNRIKVKRLFKIIIMLFLVMFIVTGLEWCSGIFIEKIFNKTLWDYSKYKFNIGKYIALEISLLWGGLTLLFVYVIKPILEKIVNKIPKYITILVLVLMFIDFFITCFQV